MIQKGSKVYIVPNDKRNAPYHRTVVSIGRKYITVDDNSSYNRFDIITKQSVNDKNDWNPRLKLYENKEEYEQQLQYASERKQLLENIEQCLQKCNNNELKQIYNIVKR